MRLSVLARTLEQLTALRKLDSSNESQHQDANADTAMFSRRRKSSNSRLSVLEESLTGLTAIEQPLETSDNQIGPLGLNLLYTPPAPLLDFIFVHGLRGGSKKTWSKTSHPYHYWPKEWLPRDPEFKHVRIHSFGYNSDWNDRKDSIINIHDIGKSLLGEMINSPEIRRNDKTQIIFISHSMGGLVVKKACILANQDPLAKSLADRLYGIIFLATPHRGADSATLLNNLLRASLLHSQKPFVADLERNSGAIQSINDDFRHYSSTLKLRSFYETIKTNIGFSNLLIVDKDSATLGYPNEQSALLNATHRDICKYQSPADPNFISLRNALVTMSQDVASKVIAVMRDQHRSQLRELQDYLSVSGIPEDDLTTLEDALLEGSCQWLTWKKQYQAWRDFHPGSLPYYWLSGQPATGKSVLAAHVLRNLEDINANCCYYFFKHNDTEKSSLSGCLRSLAYQMAVIDLRVRSHLMAMKDDEVRLDKENDLSVWRKVYLYGIFELVLDRPFFWVIDALDECSSQSNIISLLGKAYGIFPLRVFVSSRATPEISRNFSQLEELIYADELTPNDTRGDIELYLRANMRSLMLKNEPFCQKVTETILNRSCGSFLWVVLVLEELRSAFSEGEVQQVLEEVPPGMDALYKRALLLMSKTSRGKHLVKAVLLWIVCAIRPLTLKELEHAILLDTGESVLSLDKFILSTCGQLVHVDKNGRVSLIHETVRAFLLKDDLQSEFAVEKFEAHGQIAEVCLRYLNNDEMKPPRSQKLMQIHRAKAAKRSPITQYACMYFSQHLRRSHSENSQLLISLVKFLEGNVCSWIELMASTGNLHQLIRTAKDLKGFLQARAKYHSPISKEVQRVSSWEADLVRLVAQFGGGLLAVPSAIFWLIPPFCPPTSAIGSQFASLPHGITVEGLASSAWSDRSCCIHYHGKQTRAIACTDTAFVVGLSDKSIRHYSYSTYQQLQQLSVMQPTKLLALSNSGKLMAASSVHYVMMFELETGQRLWQTRSPQECLTLSFANQDKSLQILTKGGILSFISATDGSTLSYISLEETTNKTDHAGFRRIFTCATFSFELSMIAAVQRGGSIGLYDMEEGSFVGLCKRDAETELESTDFALSWVSDFLFNPNPAISLLAALYHDGNLVLFDPCQLAVVAQVETDAQVLTCSHDGRILATGDAVGTIQVLEFESLNLIYKVIASDDPIRSLVFSRDNLRFIDIRGSQCNLWEPPILVHSDTYDDDSVSDTIAVEPTIVGLSCTHHIAAITALACYTNDELVFCGKDNGDITLYSTATGMEVQIMYQHAKGTAIKLIEYGTQSNVLASADASSRVMVWKVARTGKAWVAKGPLLDARIPDYAINQLLFDANNNWLLISTLISDIIYNVNSGIKKAVSMEKKVSRRWINHHNDPRKVICVTAEAAYVRSWEHLSDPNSAETKLVLNTNGPILVKDVAIHLNGCILSIELSGSSSQQSTFKILLLSASSFDKSFANTIEPVQRILSISQKMRHVIGSHGKKFLFLDPGMWVCSLDLETFESEYSRHCFIPNEWLSTNWDLMMKVNQKGDLIYVKGHELAIIKRALDNKVGVSMNTG